MPWMRMADSCYIYRRIVQQIATIRGAGINDNCFFFSFDVKTGMP